MTRAGFVALIGEPNAGKSTLMNHIVGSKISIVTHKVQTTRARIRGIAMAQDAQIIFIDTPGLFRTKRKLDRAMVAAAWSAVSDADIAVLLVEAHRGLSDGVQMILDGLLKRNTPPKKMLLAINKIDLVPSEALLRLTAALHEHFSFQDTFMISAHKGYGVDDLQNYLATHLPKGSHLYPEDQIADVPMRMIAAEITREKLLLRLHQELPYNLTVETENWQERKDGSVRIDQTIYVTRTGHKGIALGPKGETIKAISIAARKEIKDMLEREVHLFLQIKLRPNWQDEAQRYSEMGLDFQDTK